MSKRVQIAFDLDTNKLKDVYTKATGKTYTSAYKDIGPMSRFSTS